MDKKIWYELVDIKFGEIYLAKYLSRQKLFRKSANVATLVLSGSGILGWSYFEQYAFILLCVILALQLFSLIESQIIRTESEIEEIAELRMMYTRYFLKLEEFWTKFNDNQITESEAIDRFFKLRKSDWEKIEKLDCKLDIKQYNKLKKSTEIETNNYINKYHE